MYVVYSLREEQNLLVLFDSKTERFCCFPLDLFIFGLGDEYSEIIAGLDDNNPSECIFEVPKVGTDLSGNTIRYCNILFPDYESRYKFKNGVVTLKFSDLLVHSFDLGIRSENSLVGIYYVLDTYIGDVFRGLMFITYEDGIFRQFTYVDNRLRLDAEIPKRDCKMDFSTERVLFEKGGIF